MKKLQVTYDGFQHCTALKQPQHKTVAMDCPYTGKGEELSPANLIGAGLAGCMLISMGTLAIRDKIDINGTCVEIEVEQLPGRIKSIGLTFNMKQAFSKKDRIKLERAAGLCPIKSSFHPETSIFIEYRYPETPRSKMD
jgi:uncharacterized OsmC-like protein